MTLPLKNHKRILIYSHDTFGLGHLRRCRTIAHSLVEQNKNMSVLILSGSPIIGSFDFKARVDFVRIPGVIKLRNGEYTSLNLLIDIEDTLAMRSSIIHHTADIFDPDIFIVDKEPLGLRGEVKPTLEMLRERGTTTILGLRDVMDEPSLLAAEWERKNAIPAIDALYDDVWVYGLPQICDPLEGLEIPDSVKKKIVYTGYLERHIPPASPNDYPPPNEPYILVTPGGGGDGEAMVDWVLKAYEHDFNMPYRAVIILGPFMSTESQHEFMGRAAQLDKVDIISFDAKIEKLMKEAIGVIAMGGYNTFCEILSFNKRALIIPRTEPRLEQYIRATKAEEFGLVRTLCDDGIRDPKTMATAIRHLAQQPLPRETVMPGLFDGTKNVNKLTRQKLNIAKKPKLYSVAAANSS